MVKHSEERELSNFDTSDSDRLVRFNIYKQRIVDLANQDFADDWFNDAKSYPSWNKALNGENCWVGLVDRLEGLLAEQTRHPRKYLPADDPPDADQLVPWMKQIAGAPWWHKVLNLSASTAAFNAWYSGRAMGKDKVAVVKAKVDEWWGRVKAACERAELRSLGQELSDRMRRAEVDSPGADVHDGLTSYFYHLVRECGMPEAEARALYQDMMELSVAYRAELIDLTDPKDPLELLPGRMADSREVAREAYGREFDQMVADGFPRSVPKHSPACEPCEVFQVRRWGDRRDEDSPKDLNQDLYGLHYRERTRHYWDADVRRGRSDTEIIETSEDGLTWRPATEREKQGWDRGAYFWHQALNQGVYPVENGYTRDLRELGHWFKEERDRLDKAIHGARDEGQKERARSALDAAERQFEEAKFKLRLHARE